MLDVVILGGGFGGLYAAKALGGHAKVTLIDQRNFHLFQPPLYPVAAGALAVIARDTLRQDFRHFRSEESRILLLDGSPRVLPAYPEDLSEQAARQLIRLGVRPRTNVQVVAVNKDGLTLRTVDGEKHL